MSCQECYSPGSTLVNLFYDDKDGSHLVMREDAYHGLCDRHLSAFREIVDRAINDYWRLIGGMNPAELFDGKRCVVCSEGCSPVTIHLCKVGTNDPDTVKPGNIILTSSIDLCDRHRKQFTTWFPQVALNLLDCVR